MSKGGSTFPATALPATRFLLPLFTFVASLALYTATLAPDLLPADNGEFQLVAAVWGVAHPPGYPLHTLLGGLLARAIPFGAWPWRVNLLSALLAAGTLSLLAEIVRQLTGRKLAGLAAALALGTSTTFWAQATMSNVRTPAAFFLALGVYALLRHTQNQASEQPAKYPLLWLAAALTLGLTHHLSLAFSGCFLVLYLFLVDPSLIRQPRRWRGPAVVGLLCLLPLLYLPLREGALLAPTGLSTLKGFVRHALALGFSGDFFFFRTPAELWARLQVMGNVLAFQFSPLILAGGLLGTILLLWRDRKLALMLLGGFGLHTLVTASYRAPQTVEYMLPAYVLLAITLGYGLGKLGDLTLAGRQFSSFYLLPVTLTLLSGFSQGVQHYPDYRSLAQSYDTREYATPILDDAPAGAIVLADWHWAMPLRYLQEVEGVRPDLTIQYVPPTAEEYADTWARRIQEELPERPVVVTHYDELAYIDIPAVFEPLGEAFLVRSEPRRELPADFVPVHYPFDPALTVQGYRPLASLPISHPPLTLVLAWSLDEFPAGPTTLYARLIGYDGAVYAQQDQVLDTRWLSPGDGALTQFELYPRPGALPGRYSLQLGVYTAAGPMLAADGQERVELLAVELVPAELRPFTQHPLNRSTGAGLTLIGVDWDLTWPHQPRLYLHWRAGRDTQPLTYNVQDDDLHLGQMTLPALPAGAYQTTVHTLASIPQKPSVSLAANGKTLRLPAPRPDEQYLPFGDGLVYLGYGGPGESPPTNPRLRLAASRPVLRDYVVSTSLIGLNPDQSWAWRELDDGVPALGAIPTLKWVSGSQIIDPHNLPIPADAPAGQVIGTLVIYDAFTGRTLPILDERLAAAAPWAPLGEWSYRP